MEWSVECEILSRRVFIENLYQKCVKNGIKRPADKMPATIELWNEACGLIFDVKKRYDVRPLLFSFSGQSMSNLLLDLSVLDLATKVWVSRQKS